MSDFPDSNTSFNESTRKRILKIEGCDPVSIGYIGRTEENALMYIPDETSGYFEIGETHTVLKVRTGTKLENVKFAEELKALGTEKRCKMLWVKDNDGDPTQAISSMLADQDATFDPAVSTSLFVRTGQGVISSTLTSGKRITAGTGTLSGSTKQVTPPHTEGRTSRVSILSHSSTMPESQKFKVD